MKAVGYTEAGAIDRGSVGAPSDRPHDHSRPLAAQVADVAEQGRILTRLAELVDAGTIRTTLGAHYGRTEAASLIRAHRAVESHRTRGKIVLEGF